AFDVGVRVRRAADAVREGSAARAPESTEPLDSLAQCARVDSRRRHCELRTADCGRIADCGLAREGRHAAEELAAGNHCSVAGRLPMRSSLVRSYRSPGAMK